MHMENRRKLNIPMCIALVVLCLVLFSLNMTSGMLARFTTRGTVDGQARTAKFNTDVMRVLAADEDEVIAFAQAAAEFDSTNNSYKVKVTNDSETAVRFTVTFVFKAGTLYREIEAEGQNEPETDGYLTVKMKGANDALIAADEVTTDGNYDYASFTGDNLDANAGADGAIIKEFVFAVERDEFYGVYNQTGLSIEKVELDFDTFVKVVQID